MEQPLVSICLLTYMHEKYIGDCLESLLSQTYSNMELLILDDASTDRTFEILKYYEKKLDEKFKCLAISRNPMNIGNISANFNQLITRAGGAYIKTFAGDDMMLPDYVSKIISYMEEHREAIMCYTNAYLVSDDFRWGDRPKRIFCYKEHKPVPQQDIFDALMHRCYICTPGAMIRRRAFDEYGLYDENIKYEDYDFWLRLSHNEMFDYLPGKLVYYRRGETSISNYKSADGKKKMDFMMREEQKLLKKNMRGLPKEQKRQYRQYYYNRYLRRAIISGLWGTAIQLMIFMLRKKYQVTERVLMLIHNRRKY